MSAVGDKPSYCLHLSHPVHTWLMLDHPWIMKWSMALSSCPSLHGGLGDSFTQGASDPDIYSQNNTSDYCILNQKKTIWLYDIFFIWGFNLLIDLVLREKYSAKIQLPNQQNYQTTIKPPYHSTAGLRLKVSFDTTKPKDYRLLTLLKILYIWNKIWLVIHCWRIYCWSFSV